jgi:hypothetical protein
MPQPKAQIKKSLFASFSSEKEVLPYSKAVRKIAIVVAAAANQTNERRVPRPARYTAI